MDRPVHPRERPVEPEHPMTLEGRMAPGDPRVLLRCLYEEFLRGGFSREQIRALSKHPGYQALYAARRHVGDATADELLDQAAQTTGRLRVSARYGGHDARERDAR